MYAGGKNSCYQHIINQMPPHRIYVEPFLGSGAVMRRKYPAELNIGIDLDGTAVTSAMTMPAYIAKNGDVTRHASEATLKMTMAADIARNGVTRFNFIIANAIEFLTSSKLPSNTLIYIDSPYLFSTRRSIRPMYRFELGTEKEHIELIEIVKSLSCMVIISGYMSPLYSSLLSTWRYASFMAQTRNGMREESLWMNYEEPKQLHDYRYLGSNFRERERIKRKAKRWINRFQSLPSLERHAVINELHTAGIVNNGEVFDE